MAPRRAAAEGLPAGRRCRSSLRPRWRATGRSADWPAPHTGERAGDDVPDGHERSGRPGTTEMMRRSRRPATARGYPACWSSPRSPSQRPRESAGAANGRPVPPCAHVRRRPRHRTRSPQPPRPGLAGQAARSNGRGCPGCRRSSAITVRRPRRNGTPSSPSASAQFLVALSSMPKRNSPARCEGRQARRTISRRVPGACCSTMARAKRVACRACGGPATAGLGARPRSHAGPREIRRAGGGGPGEYGDRRLTT
jgi:hypothetical protein